MKKLHAAIAVALLAAGTGLWLHRRADARETPAYRFATVERGNLEATVSATGTLDAVTTVQVGTQVSGQIAAIYTDFNQKVKKGQLLARIDPTLLEQAVEDAQAGLARNQAQLTQAQQEYDREKQLYDAKIVTASEYNTAESNYGVAKANVRSAQIALERARQNLSYTAIHAPIDGVVVERDVDVGQTVAASLQAPQLFLIANDLSQMQILASVDESDIGQIKDGQQVRFTVQAYPNRTFTGAVQQVRLQSKTADNVVNYTVVVTVANPDGALLPGMTATVQFLTGSANGALIVPNAALRIRPTADMLATLRAGRDSNTARGAARSGTDSLTASRQRGAAASGSAAGATSPRALLWYQDANGKPAAARVRTGLTDGQRTVVEGTGVKEGMQVI
ncbi:MAG TPA: efflux RND transporter periplasmic adaptor subunit, partial [Gemmatimonadaceae bacterium]|nr:efflux RND transporter periplasmic adaptor subunit [Gemmatimonadaceae bacterium]